MTMSLALNDSSSRTWTEDEIRAYRAARRRKARRALIDYTDVVRRLNAGERCSDIAREFRLAPSEVHLKACMHGYSGRKKVRQ